MPIHAIRFKGTRGGKLRIPEVMTVILNYCGTCSYFNSKTIYCLKPWFDVKAYDNKTALLKSVLKTVMDPPGGLKSFGTQGQSLTIPMKVE